MIVGHTEVEQKCAECEYAERCHSTGNIPEYCPIYALMYNRFKGNRSLMKKNLIQFLVAGLWVSTQRIAAPRKDTDAKVAFLDFADSYSSHYGMAHAEFVWKQKPLNVKDLFRKTMEMARARGVENVPNEDLIERACKCF